MNAGRTYCIAPIVTNGTMLQNVGGAPSSLDVPKNHWPCTDSQTELFQVFFSVPWMFTSPVSSAGAAEDMEAMTILQWATWCRKKSSLLRNWMMRDFHQQRVFCVVEENKVPVPIALGIWRLFKMARSQNLHFGAFLCGSQDFKASNSLVFAGRPAFFNFGFSFSGYFFRKKNRHPTLSQQHIISCVIVYVPWSLLDLA